MRMKILAEITWSLCVIGLFSTAIAVLNCTNYKGEPVADGAKFKPKEHDLCLECVCDKGSMTMCQNIFCSHPDNCKEWERVSTECCEFICLSNDYDNNLESNVHPNQTKTKNDDTTVETAASDNITTLGLRLVASTVTSFLVLALLLFMVHRLRQRRLLLAMRRYGARREEMDNFDNENLTPEYFGIQCPPYDDPPPPYSPPKPSHQILPNEAPPPYELINNNNNNISDTAHSQNTGSANNYQTSERRCRTGRREVDSIQQALNNEILQNVQQRQSLGSDTRPYTGSRRHPRRSSRLCNNNSSSSGSSDSSDQETVSVSVHTSGARYLRKSNSAVGVIGMSHDRRPHRGRDRRSVPGNCRIGHSSSFASSFTPCSHNGRHQMSHSLCNSHSHDAVARQQSHDQITKQCISESTQTSSLHRSSQRTCGHHSSRLSRDGLTSRKIDPLQLTDISNQSSQIILCQNMPNCGDSTQDGGGFLRRQDSSHNIDLDTYGGHRKSDSQSVDKLEGYVPPCFQDLNDNEETGHLALNNPYHQRYRSLPANSRLNDEKSGKQENVFDPDMLDKSPVNSNNDGQGQTQNVDETLGNTTFYMPKVKNLPLDLSPEFNSVLGQANMYNNSVGQDSMYSGELVTFKAPSTNRPQSLSQLNASVLPFHLPDMSTVSESGNSTCVSPLSNGMPDYNQLQELRLSNLLRQNHNSNSSSPGESPHQLQQAPCQNSNQSKEMPRSNSDVSMFSVCSETGEKKLGRLTNQVTGNDGHAIGNDAQYPENAFIGRPNLSVFIPREDATSYHNPKISYPNQRATMLSNSNAGNVAKAECVDNDSKRAGDAQCENNDQNERLIEDSVNGNASVNLDPNSTDNVSKLRDTSLEMSSSLSVTPHKYGSGEDHHAQFLNKESSKHPHVKLRHKSKGKKHRLSPGSLPSTISNKKRHSYASDSHGSVDLNCDVHSVDIHSLPISQVRGQKNRSRSQTRNRGGQISKSCADDDDRTSETNEHGVEEQRLPVENKDVPPRVNSWGEVSGLYAVTNIMDSYGDKRQKGPLHPKHKLKSSSGKNIKGNGNNPSLFCPANIKKRTKSGKRGSKCRNSCPSVHNFLGNDLEPVSKVPDRHLEDVQLSPLSKLGEQEVSQNTRITLTNSSLI